jgi:butyrate kinase
MTLVLGIDPGFSEVRVAVLAPTGQVALQTLPPEVNPFRWFEGRYGSHPAIVVIAGGVYARCLPGVYRINERMAEDAARLICWHPRNRLTVDAFEYCRDRGIPGAAMEPMSSVTLSPEARLSGHPDWERPGIYYAFPERAAFFLACASTGMDPSRARGITVYLGDEVSVAAHHGATVVATQDPVFCEGPFGFTSVGTLPATSFVEWLEAGEEHDGPQGDTREGLKARSGVFAYAGVGTLAGLSRKLSGEDRDAVRAVMGMAYQVSKEIGRAVAALKGSAEAIVLTGPGVSLDLLVTGIEERVAKWSRVVRVQEDDCMRALVEEGRAALFSESLKPYPEEKRS